MSADAGRVPQDVVAIFHCSFHPTQGNVLDWQLKASEDLDLSNVEFSVLPSGLHLVEEDVVYFTRGPHSGVCVFRRRRTTEHGHRGFRLSSLGILLAKSARPRPWRHVPALKTLVSAIYTSLESRGTLDMCDEVMDPARTFFEKRSVRRADLGGAGDWRGWSAELDGPDMELGPANPTLHLPHLLRILGPSVLTVYKHLLGRKRVLVFTLPPVEPASVLCQVMADMCFEAQVDAPPPNDILIDVDEDLTESPIEAGQTWGMDASASQKLKGKCREGVRVLGMVNLNDMDKLKAESDRGSGWIACTTDALFLEKPSFYDLLIDLTTSTPAKASRPTLHESRPVPPKPAARTPSHELVSIRFTWSDVKLWTELNRILARDGGGHHHHCTDCTSPTASSFPATASTPALGKPWADVWRLYEDVCLMCAGLWIGGWRSNSHASYTAAGGRWGEAREAGDADLSIEGAYVRSVGMGIEGRPAGGSVRSAKGSAFMRSASGHARSMSGSTFGIGHPRSASGSGTKRRRASAASGWSMGRSTLRGSASRSASTSKLPRGASVAEGEEYEQDDDASSSSSEAEAEAEDRAPDPQRQVLTTLALLQTFHAHTCFTLSTLAAFLPAPSVLEGGRTVVLGCKEMLAFELGPLSALDARFVEWLAAEYGGDTRVVVKRGWREVVGMMFGV